MSDIIKELENYNKKNVNKFYNKILGSLFTNVNVELVEGKYFEYYVLTKDVDNHLVVNKPFDSATFNFEEPKYERIENSLFRLVSNSRIIFYNGNPDKKWLIKKYEYYLEKRKNSFEKMFFYGASDLLLGLQQHLVGKNKIYNLDNRNKGIWKGTGYSVKNKITVDNIHYYLKKFVYKYRNNSDGLFNQPIMYVSNKFLSVLMAKQNVSFDEYIKFSKCNYIHDAFPDIKIQINKNINNNTIFIVPKNDAILFIKNENDELQLNHQQDNDNIMKNVLFLPKITYKNNILDFKTDFGFGFPNLKNYGVMYDFELSNTFRGYKD